MTDTSATAAITPLKITIHPQSQPDTGRAVNENAAVGNVPDSPQYWGQNGFSFKSFLDIINPLQHIPVISTIYQSLTGDVPSPGSDIAGGLLYGGGLGMVASIVGEIAQAQTGNTIGGNVLALLQGHSQTQVAQNTVSGGETVLSPNQRAAYNAYVTGNQKSEIGNRNDILV